MDWYHIILNLYAPCILYIGQTYRSPPEYTFCIFSQQIYLIIFLDFLSPSLFIPPQNVVYSLMLPFLVHKIFTFHLNGMLNCKYPAPGPKGLMHCGADCWDWVLTLYSTVVCIHTTCLSIKLMYIVHMCRFFLSCTKRIHDAKFLE